MILHVGISTPNVKLVIIRFFDIVYSRILSWTKNWEAWFEAVSKVFNSDLSVLSERPLYRCVLKGRAKIQHATVWSLNLELLVTSHLIQSKLILEPNIENVQFVTSVFKIARWTVLTNTTWFVTILNYLTLEILDTSLRFELLLGYGFSE